MLRLMYSTGWLMGWWMWISLSTVAAEDWPGWRGPRGDGTSEERQVPTQWDGSSGAGIVWKVPLAAAGHSSPIIWRDRLFVTGCLLPHQQRVLLCLDTQTGQARWQQVVVQAPLEQKHARNSFASGTPVTDGQFVYVTFLEPAGQKRPLPDDPDRHVTPGQMVVAAYDLQGQRRWRVRAGEFSSIHGYCSSPVLYRNLVIINGDHDGDSYLIALDRQTGKTVWKVSRPYGTRSYVTPLIRTIRGRDQLLLSGSKRVTSYDPSDGSEIWYIEGPTEQFVASLVYNGQYVFLTAGFPEHHLLAIRPDGQGDVTDSHIVWRRRRGCAYVPSPLVLDHLFLVVSDNGIASCLDAASGQQHWTKRIGRRYSASPVTANGLVYFTSDDGVTHIVRAAPEFELVQENELGESVFASPAISQGRLYLRGEQHLYCIKAQSAKPDQQP